MKTEGRGAEYIRKFFDRYKYILLPGLVGIMLLLLPVRDDGPQPVQEPEELTLRVDVSDLEQRMEETLAQIRGVGKVRVILTVSGGYETVYLSSEDRTVTENQNGYTETRRTEPWKKGTGSGAEPVVTKTLYPVFRGALVVCQGGDNAQVKLQVTEAVRALTGLAANNIVITKMKS